MGFIEGVVWVTFILTLGGVLIARTNARASHHRDARASDSELAAVQRRLDIIERRLENVETLVIEKEKQKAFDAL